MEHGNLGKLEMNGESYSMKENSMEPESVNAV